jgi:hypothetical protein
MLVCLESVHTILHYIFSLFFTIINNVKKVYQNRLPILLPDQLLTSQTCLSSSTSNAIITIFQNSAITVKWNTVAVWCDKPKPYASTAVFHDIIPPRLKEAEEKTKPMWQGGEGTSWCSGHHGDAHYDWGSYSDSAMRIFSYTRLGHRGWVTRIFTDC